MRFIKKNNMSSNFALVLAVEFSLAARSAQLKRAGWAVSTVPAGWDVPAAAGSGGWLVWSQVLSPAG